MPTVLEQPGGFGAFTAEMAKDVKGLAEELVGRGEGGKSLARTGPGGEPGHETVQSRVNLRMGECGFGCPVQLDRANPCRFVEILKALRFIPTRLKLPGARSSASKKVTAPFQQLSAGEQVSRVDQKIQVDLMTKDRVGTGVREKRKAFKVCESYPGGGKGLIESSEFGQHVGATHSIVCHLTAQAFNDRRGNSVVKSKLCRAVEEIQGEPAYIKPKLCILPIAQCKGRQALAGALG